MTDFFDWLKAAGAGEAADKLAHQFRLSPEEMRATTDALVPAYILGMQRAMIDPKSWSDLAQRFGAMGGFGGGGLLPGSAGELVTGSLFGPDLTAAIARNASVLTGQAPDILQKMMAPFGAMVFSAALQTLAAGASNWPKGYATDTAGQAMAEAMRRSANAVEAFHRPSNAVPNAPAPGTPAAMMNLFSDAWRSAFPWMPQAPQAGIAAPSSPFDPLGLVAAMTQGFALAPPAPRAPSSSDSREKRRDPVLDMITNAQSLQADYLKSMMMLFEKKAEPKG